MSQAPERRTVLVLDDEEPIRRTVQRILEMHDYEVLTAADAREALRILDHHPGPIQAILCDLILPGLGGREAANAMMGRRPEARVMFMSGYSSHSSGRRDVQQAGHRFLSKPFEVGELLEAVESLFQDEE